MNPSTYKIRNSCLTKSTTIIEKSDQSYPNLPVSDGFPLFECSGFEAPKQDPKIIFTDITTSELGTSSESNFADLKDIPYNTPQKRYQWIR